MKKNEVISAPDKETLKIYDEICGATLVNLFTLSKESDSIALRNFDPKNKEHMFLLGVAKGLAGAIGKKLCLDVNKFQLWKLNRGIDKDCRIIRIDGKEAIYSIDPNMLLDFMREKAVAASNDKNIFVNIYEQYYARKKGKR